MNRANGNKFRKVTRPQKSSSRITICFCFFTLLIAAILSISIYAFHLNNIAVEEGNQFLNYIQNNRLNDVLSGVMDSMHLRAKPVNSAHTIDDPSHPANEAKNTFPVEDREETPQPTPKPTAPIPVIKLDFDEMHFIHIPKCGGTTMTAVLRQFQCQRNPEKNKDCCTNPGFCDWHAMRRCSTIKGCINHFPQIKFLYKEKIPSITVFRDPTARLLSAWFYRGHSPNLDFFQVRPYFKQISEGKLPKVQFDEYIEMVEYQNIQTRMLGADSFPYRNISITEEMFQKAADNINRFFFVGLQEEFDVSAVLLAREIGLKDSNVTVVKEREQQGMKQIKLKKAEITSNATLMARVREVNNYDLRLFKLAVRRFCQIASKHPDLFAQIKQRGKVDCSDVSS